jgi:hypothetical protein
MSISVAKVTPVTEFIDASSASNHISLSLFARRLNQNKK